MTSTTAAAVNSLTMGASSSAYLDCCLCDSESRIRKDNPSSRRGIPPIPPAGFLYVKPISNLNDQLKSSPQSTCQERCLYDSRLQDQTETSCWTHSFSSNPLAGFASDWNDQQIVHPSALKSLDLRSRQRRSRNSVTFDDNVMWLSPTVFRSHEYQSDIDQSFRTTPGSHLRCAVADSSSPKRPLSGCLKQLSWIDAPDTLSDWTDDKQKNVLETMRGNPKCAEDTTQWTNCLPRR